MKYLLKRAFINRIVFAKFSHFLFCKNFPFFAKQITTNKREREKEKIYAFFACERNAKFRKTLSAFRWKPYSRSWDSSPELKICYSPLSRGLDGNIQNRTFLPSALAVVCLREKLTLKKKISKKKK